MTFEHSAINRQVMKVLGLRIPPISHREMLRQVATSTATVVGFGFGSWLFGAPLDRESAIALFVGFLYIGLADPFLSMSDAKVKRYALTVCGAGMLIASAALFEQFI